ncbi:hypothetical protein Pint_30769 [Pistacia integerrima]|uniref:Uncharacterized protein n=1 Tax=Pistacia integerrima TaxID=434235 RepID=A0ACC0X0B4_9ROSI|nr:hypothetical protein Pint_30769 [Pistacia integerrima]
MFKNEAFDFFFFLGNLQYNFEGRYDMVKFMKLVAEAGLYFIYASVHMSVLNGTTEDFLFGCILYRELSFEMITNHTSAAIYNQNCWSAEAGETLCLSTLKEDPSFYNS